MTKLTGGTGGGTHDEVIAGEYVLGVLPAETARQVEGRLKTDRQFAAMVRRWRENLADPYEVDGDPWMVAGPDARRGRGLPLMARPARPVARPALTLWRGICLVFAGVAAGYVFAGMEAELPVSPDMAARTLSAEYDAGKGEVVVHAAFAGVPAARVWLIEPSGAAHLLGERAAGGVIALTPQARQMMDQGASIAVAPAN